MTIGSLLELGYGSLNFDLAEDFDLSDLSSAGCSDFCPTATGSGASRRLSRPGFSEEDTQKMMVSEAEKLAESRAMRTVNEDDPDEILVYGEFISILVRGRTCPWGYLFLGGCETFGCNSLMIASFLPGVTSCYSSLCITEVVPLSHSRVCH
jgi:hypothetical protein